MHTWYYRLNALFTVASTVLACLCVLASLTEILHKGNPSVNISNIRVEGLRPERGNDRAWISLDVDADLHSLFTWNTKQAYVYSTVDFRTKRNNLNSITVFDKIVQRAADAHVKEARIKIKWPFALTDQGVTLRNCPFNITIAWETVPVSGVLLRDHKTFTGFRMPSNYSEPVRNPARQWS